jgi:hypothetical protein
LGYIDGIHVTIYRSTMDPMGNEIGVIFTNLFRQDKHIAGGAVTFRGLDFFEAEKRSGGPP